jgi:hypothetical protein
MHAELERDQDRHAVLARFVSGLRPADEELLRELLEADADPRKPV